MKTFFRALGALVLLAATVQAADPVPGKLVDATFLKQFAETRGFMLGRPQKPKISPDGQTVLFLRSEAKSPRQKLFEFNVASGQTKELLSPEMLLKGGDENLTPEEKARRERQRVTVGGFTDFHLDKDGTHILVMLAGKLYVFDRASAKATQLKTGEGGAIVDPKWSPDGKRIAYVRGFDVYVYDLAAGKESPVTTGGTAIKTHGLAEFVAQEEMGRHSGFWWSPDSKFIAYEEADHTGVETWWIADPLKPDQKPAEQFYPRPGKKNVAVRLGIVPVGGGKTVWVEWDAPQRGDSKFEYLAAVHWYEHAMLLQVQDRAQQFLLMRRVDPTTGKTTSIHGEEDYTITGVIHRNQVWVNLHPESPPHFNEALRGFVWLSNDAEVQVRDLDNGLLREKSVPDSQHPVEVMAVYSSGAGTFIVYAGGPDPTQRLVFRHRCTKPDVKPGVDKDEILSPINAQSSAVFTKNDGPYVLTSTNLNAMPASTVFSIDGKKMGGLPSVALDPTFKPNASVEKVGWFEPSTYWTAIVRPRDFDPKKKYPVIVDVYGGPKHLHVVQAMRNWLVPQWLADQGFIVVAIDNRGTPGRGRDWERAIYQKFGTVPIEDQVKGLHALCDKFPELDRDRVGIVGWSFGGYMAANGVLRRPDVFKAAVAGAPVTDWEDYDTHYTERYMGLLPESKRAYDEASLIPLAKNLKRPLLLVHGTADDNVYYRHTLKLSNALFRAGKDFETLALPGVTHMVSADPVVMERLWAKTATFFKFHLGVPR